MDDYRDWLGGQAPFSKMPVAQLRALADETVDYNGMRIPGLNAASARREIDKRIARNRHEVLCMELGVNPPYPEGY